MRKAFWLIVFMLAALFVLDSFGVFTGRAELLVGRILGLAYALACPLFFLMLFYAPGLFQDLTAGVSHSWRRFVTQRRDMDSLERKIAHMEKPHHMIQLGAMYQRQGRTAKAAAWFERALEKDPDSLEARYRLALCRFDQGQFAASAELLEEIQNEKPQHDYGLAPLRLAQAHFKLGNLDRADAVFTSLLQFYPGQPEGSYHLGLLKSRLNEKEKARELMRDVIFAVRHSPPFQRRRNRHWMLKAWWWLRRN